MNDKQSKTMMDSLQLIEVEPKDGLRVFAARDCRFRADELLRGHFVARPEAKEESRAYGDDDDRKYGDDDDDRKYGDDDKKYNRDLTIITAIASSTGVDSHGTEMTYDALRGMAEQMNGGVSYVPAHAEAEWDDVMGYTVEAEVVRGTILHDGATKSEGDGYHLRVKVGLYPDHEKTDLLVRSLARSGSPIGTSIGGWFTDIEFMVNEEEKVERVLIKEVELDHLATTRRPSNRESWIESLRSRAQEAISTRSDVDAQPAEPAEPAEVLSAEPAEVLSAEPTDSRATASVDAPAGHHWMDYKEGPVLMEGEDADHIGGSKSFDFELVEEHDPSRLKQKYKPDDPEAEYSQPDIDETVSPAEDSELDKPTSVSEDCIGPDAEQRAAPTEEPSTLSREEGNMSETITPDVVEGAAANSDDRLDRLERSIASLTQAVATLAERSVAPAATEVETPEQRAEKAERMAKLLQEKLNRAMTSAGRVGLGNVTRERVAAVGGYPGMVKRAAASLGEASALRMVCEQQAERRESGDSDRRQLTTDLRSVLAAAFADGIIRDPASSTGWE